MNPIRKQTVATTTGSARELPEELPLPAPESMWVELPVTAFSLRTDSRSPFTTSMQEFRRVEADETHESDSRKPSGAADPSGEAFRVAAFARGGPRSSGPPGARPGLQWRLLRVGWRMQPGDRDAAQPSMPILSRNSSHQP